jgi:hypothetical protein
VPGQIRHAGAAAVVVALRVAGRRPVVVERQFDADAEAAGGERLK